MLRSRLLGMMATVAAALLLSSAPSRAGKQDDTLTLAWERDLQTLDYYNVLESSGLTLAHNVWDMLVQLDPTTGEYKPLLATSWTWDSPTQITFKLRKGIRFHNGEPFDADDVVYTINMVTNKENKVINNQMVAWMDHAEKIDQDTVRIVLKQPFPAALEYLATGVPIYPNEYHQKVGKEGMAKSPIGTGPYKVVEFEAGKSYTLAKNENYFADSPKGQPKIGKIVLRTLKDPELRIAEIISGQADLLWQVNKDQAEQLSQFPNLVFTPVETMRTMFLFIEPNGMAKKHPLTDVRVRKAIAHAINRGEILKNLMSEGSAILDLVCFPGQFGCAAKVPTYEYDPDKARKLLADAGYPDGFDVEIWETTDRFLTEAIMGDLQKVGIRTKVRTVVWPAMYEGWTNGEAVLGQSSTTHWSIKDVSITLSAYFGGNPQDTAKDKAVHELIAKANNSLDPEERKKLYGDALTRIAEGVYWVPLFTKGNNYVHSADLNFKGSFDEIIRFYEASWR